MIEITPMTMYWFTRLDNIHATIGGITIVLIAAFIFSMAGFFVSKIETDDPIAISLRRIFPITSIALAIFLALANLFPT